MIIQTILVLSVGVGVGVGVIGINGFVPIAKTWLPTYVPVIPL